MLNVRNPKLHDLSTLHHFSFIAIERHFSFITIECHFSFIMIDHKPCYTISSTKYVSYIYKIFYTLFCIWYIFKIKFLKHGLNTHHTFFIRLKFKIKYPTLLLRFFKFLHYMNRNALVFKLTWFRRLTHSDFPMLFRY
jgi:hypothetical protein